MGWIDRLLGKKNQQQLVAEGQQQKQANSKIAFHNGLMDEYLGTHEELCALIESIGEAAKNQRFAEVHDNLAAFKAAFDGHLLSENVRLYGYLEQQFVDQPDNYQLIKDFRNEMHGIAREVSKFIRFWREATVTPSNLPQFLTEYEKIVQVFERRLNAEEQNLYPLYQPA